MTNKTWNLYGDQSTHYTPWITVAALVVAALATIQCGKASSPTAPSSTGLLAGISLDLASVPAGTSVRGTVALSSAATTDRTIALASSSVSVATVQNAVTVPADATTASFTVEAVSVGTAAITATLGGSSSQSATVTVTPAAELSAISLQSSSVVGGESVNATVTLTAAAPHGGAIVSLSGSDPVTVPQSVTVPSGSLSATFTILTREVGGTVSVPIHGTYRGVSATVTLSVTRATTARAGFGVSGSSGTETCTIENNGSMLGCEFNGSTSRAPGNIVAYDWSWSVAGLFTQTTTGPLLTNPNIDCSLLPPPPLPAGNPGWFAMTVTLTIHDDQGASAEAINSGIRLIPHGACGY